MQMKRISAALLAAAMLMSLAACSRGGEGASGSGTAANAGATDEAQKTQGVAVQTRSVHAETIYAGSTVSGSVAAEDSATVMVALSTKVIETYVEAGDQVTAGQVLCRLNLDSTLADYSAAGIGYRSAIQSYNDQKAVFDKQIALQEKNVNDLKALFEIGAASQAEIDQAELQLQQTISTSHSTLNQLEAGIQSARSGVEKLDTSLENIDSQGNVLAPMSGTLVTFNAVKDSYVANTMPLAVINGAEQMKVTVSVSESLVPKLAIGDTAEVKVSAAGVSFTGTIRAMERAANMQKLFAVTISVPADVSGLLAGMFAEVTFHTDASENAISVPSEAILTSGSTQYVYVVEGNTAKYTVVTTGLTGSGVTEVTSGLAEGQQLVTVGQNYLHDGDAVRVVGTED